MNVRYRVELSEVERQELKALLSGGRHSARKLKRAQILLAADAGACDEEIGRSVGVDFAECMRDLVDLHYPMAEVIRVVLDNLSTHSPGALYEAFPAPEAHRILRRLDLHYTPKHAPLGSTWSRSRSAFCGLNASIAASTTATSLRPRSPSGSVSEMPKALTSNGCSPLSEPASRWSGHTQTHSTSHNLCAKVLVPFFDRQSCAPSDVAAEYPAAFQCTEIGLGPAVGRHRRLGRLALLQPFPEIVLVAGKLCLEPLFGISHVVE